MKNKLCTHGSALVSRYNIAACHFTARQPPKLKAASRPPRTMDAPSAPPSLSFRKHGRVSRMYTNELQLSDVGTGISCTWQLTECFSLLGLRSSVKQGPRSARHESQFRDYVYIGHLQRGMFMAMGCAVGHALMTLVFNDVWYYSSWLLNTWQKAFGGITVAVDLLCFLFLAYGMVYRDSPMGRTIEKHSQMCVCTFLCTMVTW